MPAWRRRRGVPEWFERRTPHARSALWPKLFCVPQVLTQSLRKTHRDRQESDRFVDSVDLQIPSKPSRIGMPCSPQGAELRAFTTRLPRIGTRPVAAESRRAFRSLTIRAKHALPRRSRSNMHTPSDETLLRTRSARCGRTLPPTCFIGIHDSPWAWREPHQIRGQTKTMHAAAGKIRIAARTGPVANRSTASASCGLLWPSRSSR